MNALVFEELDQVRSLLSASPLVGSLELAAAPLARAVDLLGEPGTLPVGTLSLEERERLAREVTGIGLLLNGLGQWLASRGALSPTYTRAAAISPEPGRPGGLRIYEG
jgi:hypothetical protein